MAKSDAELMRDHINLLMEGEQIAEQRPMGLLRSLNLQVQKAFNTQGADTQLWSGNYANAIYTNWIKQAPPESTGDDFIDWYSQSKATSDVQRVEDAFIRSIVVKHMNGRTEDPITKAQASKIANDLAMTTARHALGMTRRFLNMSTPQQRDQAVQILQRMLSLLQPRIQSGGVSLAMIGRYLTVDEKLNKQAVKKGFNTYYRALKGMFPGYSASEFGPDNRTMLNSEQLAALIPSLDDLLLICVIAHDRMSNTAAASSAAASSPPPPPPPAPPDVRAEFTNIYTDLVALGLATDKAADIATKLMRL
jgi:hypothetical protein